MPRWRRSSWRCARAGLKAIELDRELVYITNVLKSRPPGNRAPKPEEVDACAPYLRRQIELSVIRPMQPADIDSVVHLEEAAYDFPWTAGIFRDCLHIGNVPGSATPWPGQGLFPSPTRLRFTFV